MLTADSIVSAGHTYDIVCFTPRRCRIGTEVFVRWLEFSQHEIPVDACNRQKEALALDINSSIERWISGTQNVAATFSTWSAEVGRTPGWRHNWIANEALVQNRLLKQLYEVRLELGLLDGMTDEWFADEVPNSVKNILRAQFLESY